MYVIKKPDFPFKEIIIASQFLCPKDHMYKADAVAVFSCNHNLVMHKAGLAFRQKQVAYIGVFSIGHMFDTDYLVLENDHKRDEDRFFRSNFTEEELVCVDSAEGLAQNNTATMKELGQRTSLKTLVIASRSIYQRRAFLITQSLIKQQGMAEPSYINLPVQEEIKVSVQYASKILSELNILINPEKFGLDITCKVPQEVKSAKKAIKKYVQYFYN